MPYRFLILNPPDSCLDLLEQAFRQVCPSPHTVVPARSVAEALEVLQPGHQWDVVVADVDIGDGRLDGAKLIHQLRGACVDIPLVAVAKKGSVEIAARAIEAGANDFMVREGDLKGRVHTLLEKLEPHLLLLQRNRVLRKQNRYLSEAAEVRDAIVGESPQIRKVMDQVLNVAAIPRPILITGERGTGKELVARAIHEAGGTPGRPMISVNCAAFSDSLLESELFGHEKGAFTGAESQVMGKFELASGGTLFLDEIGNMSLSFQQKILRVVEYGVMTRVGGTEEIQVRTRIIAATNVDLADQMDKGLFLRDLYDRLSFEVIEVPPVRLREGDVPILARHFLTLFMREIPDFQGKRLSAEALRSLEAYAFPGNVRELKNIIERAAYRDTTNEITPADIGMLTADVMSGSGGSFTEQVEAFKRRLILEAYSRADGNQAEAARELGISYHQYRYFLKKYTQAD